MIYRFVALTPSDEAPIVEGWAEDTASFVEKVKRDLGVQDAIAFFYGGEPKILDYHQYTYLQSELETRYYNVVICNDVIRLLDDILSGQYKKNLPKI